MRATSTNCLRRLKTSLERWFQLANVLLAHPRSHSNAMLQNQHHPGRKDDQFTLDSTRLHYQVETVAIGGWRWVMIQWKDRVLQLKSDWKRSTNVPAVKTSAWDFQRGIKRERGGGENNKRARRSRACHAASDSVFLKAFALISSSSYQCLFKWETHCAKRRRIRQARQLLNGNTGSRG